MTRNPIAGARCSAEIWHNLYQRSHLDCQGVMTPSFGPPIITICFNRRTFAFQSVIQTRKIFEKNYHKQPNKTNKSTRFQNPKINLTVLILIFTSFIMKLFWARFGMNKSILWHSSSCQQGLLEKQTIGGNVQSIIVAVIIIDIIPWLLVFNVSLLRTGR